MSLLKKTMKFGKKMVKMYDKVKMTEKMNYDDLYEIIKDGDYPLGQPAITGNGIMRAIRFDPTGKYQVMVAISGKTITISKSYANLGGFVKEAALDSVTDGLYHGLNKENLDGNEAVELIGKEIARLLEEKGLLASN